LEEGVGVRYRSRHMSRPLPSPLGGPRIRAWLVAPALMFALGLALAACGHSIGDSCKANVDCSPMGDRFCDTSAPDGYCTIEGCDETTCPSEAVCVRFFTPFLGRPCDFNPALPNSRSDCHVDERCLRCDSSVAGASCQSSGLCAPEASERRWCQKTCHKDSDCRDANYVCRSTGTLGAEPVPTLDMSAGTPAKFCAPRG
jgi:hypothetical protein